MPKHGVTTFLEALESDCATFFDLVPDLLVCTDRGGNIMRVNRSFEQALGRTRAEMYGSALMQIVMADDLSRFIRAFRYPDPDNPETFRLLHKAHGVVTCRLLRWARRPSGRSFIVMRRAMNNEIDHELRSAIAMMRTAIDVLSDIRDKLNTQGTPTPPARVLFGSPCSGVLNASNVWGLDWFDATGFAVVYPGGLHTGADLNRPSYLDSGANVFAAADGVVRFAGNVKGWQGDVVVIEHTLEDGAHVWTRYAHVTRDVGIAAGVSIKRGQVLGVIGDYNKDGVKGDHLHFDVCRIDLGVKPGDWPGSDKARVLRDYIEPAAWLRERSK